MRVELDGMVALVTGSTGGIGEAIARELAENGATTVINGRSRDRAEALVDSLEANDGTADYALADINDYDQVAGMVEDIVEEHGGLDLLAVSGAASSGPVPRFFRETPPEDLEAFCTSMYLNRMYAVKAALEPLIDANGRVVLVSADAGRWPTPGEVGPGTASAAVMMATKVLASEHARWTSTSTPLPYR
jgi:NAD(P)-dependent dehydrogenase (short-subunit alcohol dehydrogenase family)